MIIDLKHLAGLFLFIAHMAEYVDAYRQKRAGNILLDVLDHADAGRCAFIAKDKLCCLTVEKCITVEL